MGEAEVPSWSITCPMRCTYSKNNSVGSSTLTWDWGVPSTTRAKAPFTQRSGSMTARNPLLPSTTEGWVSSLITESSHDGIRE